jgi:O-antigen/teichoic acid export membrane protein
VANKEQQVRNSFLYLLPLITNNILPLVTLPVFTRLLSPQDYGLLALIQVYAIIVDSVANFGMTLAYDRNYFQYQGNPTHQAKLFYTILTFVTVNFGIIFFFTIVFNENVSKLVIGTPGQGNMILIACGAQFFYRLNNYYLAYYKNSENAEGYVVYSIAYSLGVFLISLFLVAYLRIGIIGILYAQFFSGVIVFSFLSFKFLLLFPLSLSRSMLVEALRLCYPLTPRILLGTLNTQFDKYIIGHLTSIGGAGVYSIGQKISNIVFAYMSAIQNVFGPQVYKIMFYKKTEEREQIGKYLTPFFYVTTLVALIMALFSEEAIVILTPGDYHGAIDIVSVLSIYYALMFFGKIAGQQLFFAQKTSISSFLGIISIGFTVSTSYLFAIEWGAIGVASALLLTSFFIGIISFFVGQYFYRIDWEYGKIGMICVFLLGSSLGAIFLRNMQTEYYICLIGKILSVIFYGYIGFRIGVLSPESVSMIKRSLRGTIG